MADKRFRAVDSIALTLNAERLLYAGQQSNFTMLSHPSLRDGDPSRSFGGIIEKIHLRQFLIDAAA
jgi:hypothetical protein